MHEHESEISDESLELIPEFEEYMLKRVNRDVAEAMQFMKPLHREALDNFKLFNRGREYTELRTGNIYPTDFFAEQVDSATSSQMSAIWAKDEPCKLIPGPGTKSEEVELKQKLHEYQNREDNLKTTHRICIHDINLYGIGIAKTDYIEKFETIWGTEEVPVTQTMQEIDPITQEPVGEFEQPVINPETMQPETRLVSVPKKSILYKGPTTERIDIQNLFFGVDKRRSDNRPVMIRSFVDNEFFESQPYFINQDKIKALEEKNSEEENSSEPSTIAKRRVLNMRDEESRSRKEKVYFEWQGMVDKGRLFEHLGPEMKTDPRSGLEVDVHSSELVEKGEKVMCVCGIVNNEIVARLGEFFLSDHSNLVMGISTPLDDEVIGDSVARQVKPAAMMIDTLAGVMFKALRLAVNRGHIINKSAVVGDIPDVNSDGFVLTVNGSVNDAHTILDQPSVSQDIYQSIALVEQWARNRTGRSEVGAGRSDPNAETLGENEMVDNASSIRSSDPLEQIESTFIIPLARIRDEINGIFLTDPEYMMEVLGEEEAQAWQPMSPEQIRAHTRFLCESSGREQQKSVITGLLLRLNQIAPNIISAGQEVRLDRAMYQLQTDGFGRSSEEAEYILPTVKMENLNGTGEQMDELMAANQTGRAQLEQMTQQLQQLQLQIQMMVAPEMAMNGLDGGGGGGGASPGGGGGGSVAGPNQEVSQQTGAGGVSDSVMSEARG
jgi:hypothetical protein